MIISYYGKQFFKIQQGDTILAINPLSKENYLKKKAVKFAADIVLSSMFHPDFNGIDQMSYGEKEAFPIYGPGSYEVNGIPIHGYGHKVSWNGKDYINTVYFFEIDGISFAFIGGMNEANLSQEAREHIDSVDLIFVPIGGEGTLDAVQASKVIKDFSPKIIIPMDYGSDREKDSLSTFLKEMGKTEENESMDKFVFKKSQLEGVSDKIILLKEN